MPRKANPTVYGDEANMLKGLNPDWEDPNDEDAEEEEDTRQKLTRKQNMFEGIEDHLYGTVQGAGYLRAPNARGGYVNPPSGGFLPLLPIAMMASSFLPMLFGKGKKRGGAYMKDGKMIPNKMIGLMRHPNMSSASAFFRDVVQQGHKQGMGLGMWKKLFGSTNLMNRMLTGRVGSGVVDKLQMGHLLSGPVYNHLQKALKGSGISADDVMPEIENLPLFNEDVSLDGLKRGGSIIGSLWTGLKSVMGKAGPLIKKIISNPRLKKIATDSLSKIGDVAERNAPALAEKAANRVVDYANRKLKGDEPTPSKSEKAVAKAPKASRYDDIEDDDDDDDYELPSGRSDSNLRKNLANQRKNSTAVAPKPTGEKRIVGWDMGSPIYGEGRKLKKNAKIRGGSWKVSLTRA